jgi:spermidine/putrescine transport system ATP-binding protein
MLSGPQATAGHGLAGFERADVHLNNVVKIYGLHNAVDNINLTIKSGEFFSLLGPSGCGKSTTLAMIGGFEEPTYGSIMLGGVDVSHQPAYRRDVNTVFQSYALFPHLTVFENVAFGLRRKGVAKDEIAARVNEMLALVDLKGFEKRWPARLSGGQQQRVALARALVNRPKLLLLDEPLGALDLKLRRQMQLELKRIQVEIGITFLFVTHDQEEAMVMSDRLAVMAGGRIEQVGTPSDVYDNPASEFVANFLGISNLLSGTLDERGPQVSWLRLEDGSRLQFQTARLKSGSVALKAGVRPEKLRILTRNEPADPDWNVLEGTVEVVTYMGVNHQYNVRGPAGQGLSVYVQNIGLNSDLKPGDPVRLAWHRDHTFIIEPPSSAKPGV